MKNHTYQVVNPEGFGKTTDQKIAESAERFGSEYKMIDGERAAYGCPEYSIIKTTEPIDSDFMRSISYNTRVKEL